MSTRNSTALLAAVIVLALAGIVAICVVADRAQCREIARSAHTRTEWHWSTWCLVDAGDGRMVPYDRWYVTR